jgi:hypothetical protein
VSAAWTAAIATVAAVALTVLGWAGRWVWRIMMRTSRFMDDYFGEPARPGVAERPGVMARLQRVEKIATDVRAETRPNGGHSLRDVVHRTAADVQDVKADVAALKGRVELFEAQREVRERVETVTVRPVQPPEEGKQS